MQTQRHNLSLILTDTRTQVMFLSGDPGSKTLGGVEGGPCIPSLNKQSSGLLHFPDVTGAKPRHCVAHRPADTATQLARDLPAGHRVDIY